MIAALAAFLAQQRLQHVAAARMQLDHLRAVGLGDSRSLMNAVVRLPIDDQQVALAGQGGNQPDVGQRHARENERVFDAQPAGQPLFGLAYTAPRWKRPARRRCACPTCGSASTIAFCTRSSRSRPRKLSEPKLTTSRPRIRARAVIVHVVDHQVLEMDVRTAVQKLQADPRDFVPLEPGAQPIHRRICAGTGACEAWLAVPFPLSAFTSSAGEASEEAVSKLTLMGWVV